MPPCFLQVKYRLLLAWSYGYPCLGSRYLIYLILLPIKGALL